jgi:hypothetical protein
MAKSNHNTLDQIDLTIDLLLSQLHTFKCTVTKLRENMADVSTPALGNGNEQVLSDEHIATLLTRRNQTRAKRGK